MPRSDEPARYCVIGAGAAGLAAVNALRTSGFAVDCFERSDRIGGHWHTDYEALHLITPRDSSGFIGAPMPDAYPIFPSRDQMRDYLTGYAETMGLTDAITLGCEVIRADPVGGQGGGGWRVLTADGSERTYAGLVVASGHLWQQRVPDVARGFTGRSLHSGAYRNPTDLTGPRVLVVGNGNSGCDVAVDAAQARFATSISVRSGRIYQPKTLFGRPRSELPGVTKLPPRIRELAMRYLIRVAAGQAADYGLPMPASKNLDKNLPVVNSLLPYWIQHGRIRVRPGIAQIRGTSVRFEDGSCEEFDSIVWATGFDVSMPFLDSTLLRGANGVPDRVAAAVLPPRLARLYFIGFAAPRGPQLPAYSQQAELLTRLLRLQEQVQGALAEHHSFPRSPDGELDVVRHVWEEDVRKSLAMADAALRRSAQWADGPQRSA